MVKVSSLNRVISIATVRKYVNATKAITRGLASPIVLGLGEVLCKDL